jgi:hypothetical protein
VDRLTAAEGITKAEAFARIAAESGRRPGTVAAAYYRAARAAGMGRTRRRRAAAGAGDGAERLVSSLQKALGELAALASRQEQELSRLRAEAARYAEIRMLLEASGPARSGRRRRAGGQSRPDPLTFAGLMGRRGSAESPASLTAPRLKVRREAGDVALRDLVHGSSRRLRQ